LNRGELRARVRETIRDESSAFILDNEINDWLHEAYLDLCARLRLLRNRATGTTTATGTILLPATPVVLDVTRLRIAGDRTDTQPADDGVFISWQLDGSSPPVRLFRIFDGTIETHPAAVSVTYTLEYVQEPVALADDGASPEITEHLQTKMVRYAQAQAMLKSDDAGRFSAYEHLYEDGLPAPAGLVHNDRPGPITISPEMGYFDSGEYLT